MSILVRPQVSCVLVVPEGLAAFEVEVVILRRVGAVGVRNVEGFGRQGERLPLTQQQKLIYLDAESPELVEPSGRLLLHIVFTRSKPYS